MTVALCLTAITKISAAQEFQQKQKNQKTMESEKTAESKNVVQQFFTAFGNGELNKVISLFHDNAVIIGVRDTKHENGRIYGTYHGKDGISTFISSLGKTFDTRLFEVESIIGEGNIAFANGRFIHVVRATGKTFSSAWALKCVVKGGRISEYHFYEDSEKFAEANRK